MVTISAVIMAFVIFLAMKIFIVVPEKQAFIIERLGNFQKTLESGLHLLIPILDRIAYRHTLKEEVIDVAPQVCITKDNVQVEVDGILYIRVMDAKMASYGINDYHFASIQLAQTAMRSEIGKLDLDRTFVEREKINDSVVRSLDQASEPWGIKVTRYEIRNIHPPPSVINAMEQQMRAERDKRAEIAHSEGQRTATINRSQGSRQQSINLSEGEKQKRINEAEGRAREIEVLAEATSESIRLVAEAINAPGGQSAVDLRIAENFIQEFGGILAHSQTSVVPLDLAKIQGAFVGLTEILGGLKAQNPQGQQKK